MTNERHPDSLWFDTARLGMFVHWGHYAEQGVEASWPMVAAEFVPLIAPAMKVDDYYASAKRFDPQAYDPASWAALAKRMGMQYAVFTTKHHDGYAMYDTKLTDFGVMQSPYGRDIYRQFADAMRAEGIRVGAYFSLSDWHHPDYPAFREEDKPYAWGRRPQPSPEQWARFIDVLFGQVREVLTNYGRIDVIWFDGGWERTVEQWKAAELRAMIKELQPQVMINDRLPGHGDYETPEQFVPAIAPAGPWETCMTLNESWGYNKLDPYFKSARRVVHTLCEIAGKGGNFLLNISPMGDGRLQPEALEPMEAVAAWMQRHQESIVGTTPGLEAWQCYGPSTRRENRVYVHLLMRPYETVTVRGVRISRVRDVTALGTGATLKHRTRCSIPDQMANRDPLGELTVTVPPEAIDDLATVLAIDFEGDPV